MDSANRFIIRISGLSEGAADQAADSLESHLNSLGEAEVERVRDDPRHQDFGASVAVVLAAPAAVAIAKGLAHWLARREDGEVIIVTADGSTVVARGRPAQKLDVAKTAAALRGEPSPP